MGTIYTGNTAAMGGSSTSYTYQAICIQTNCSTTPASWNVYRNGTLLTAAASSEVQYTDTQTDGGSAPNVTFTIPKSSSGSYGQGYNLTFTSRKSATDSGEDKIYKVMTDGATIYVNANTTLNVHGISEAGSFLEPNTTTTTYNLVNNGTINLDLGTLNVSGSLTGSGILEGTVDGSVLMAAGSSTAKTFGTTSGSNTWKVGTLGFRNRSASAVTYTLSAGGTGDLVVLGYTSIGNELDPQTTTVTNATNNRVLRLTSVNIGADGGFTASATALLSIEAEWNFATGGVFTPSGGTVTFTGANPSTLSGTTTFANLTISSPISKTMNFSTSGIVHVTGVFSAQGLIGQPHLLQSTSGGTKWHFHPTGTYSIDNIQVKDGGCETGALSMTVSNSTNLGNNESCWVFNDTTSEANRLNSGTIRGGSGTIRIK
jgi:Fe-S cluster assembly iron-binding protein IscA